jgi:type I site-specific restriction-modification system R (restriction) subunit
VSRAVVSTEIVDIMKAAGMSSPGISILSDDFLAEVSEMDRGNLGLKALRKFINAEVHSQSKRNVTQASAFSNRLQDAIARYHANAITTVRVLEEPIQLAKDIRRHGNGAKSGFSDEEIAFSESVLLARAESVGESGRRIPDPRCMMGLLCAERCCFSSPLPLLPPDSKSSSLKITSSRPTSLAAIRSSSWM